MKYHTDGKKMFVINALLVDNTDTPNANINTDSQSFFLLNNLEKVHCFPPVKSLVSNSMFCFPYANLV